MTTYTLNPNNIMATNTHILEEIILKSGESCAAGEVVGKEAYKTSVSGDWVADSSNSGDGVLAAVVIRAGALIQLGDYILECINIFGTDGAVFQLVGPDGITLSKKFIVPDGEATVDFVGYEFTFTLSNNVDNSSPFAIGDFYTVTIEAGTNKYIAAVRTNTNGADKNLAVLPSKVDASLADVTTSAIRIGPVLLMNLTYDSSYTETQIKQALKDVQINAVGE